MSGAARVRRRWAWTVALGLVAVGASPLAGLQRFETGRIPPDVRMTVVREPYELRGGTAEEILVELRTLAPVAGWVWYPLRYTWDFDLERQVSAIQGIPSTQCRLTELGMELDFTVVYPEWVRPDDAPDELVAAWDAFADLITRSWESRRDDAFAHVRAVQSLVRDREDTCDTYAERLQAVITDTFDREPPARLVTHEPAPTLRWPPPGHERLFAGPPPPVPLPPLSGRDEPVAAGSTPALPRPRRDVAAAVAAEPAPRVPPMSELMAAVEADLEGFDPVTGASGFVVGLVHEGEPVLFDAFGTSETAGGDSLTVGHVFAFPAFTEVLVSTLGAALGELGLIDLDAPLSRLLPDLSPRLGSATLGQLISHRAGLDNAAPRDSTAAWDAVLDALSDRALVADPGTLYSYSRYSYGLAVRAIEARVGTSVEDAIRQAILQPLGMENTSFGTRDADDALDELPVTYTTAPDLAAFWLSWLAGDIRGSGPEALASAPTDGPAGAGRSFYRGAWVDRFDGTERVALLCTAGATAAGFEVLPASRSILVVGSSGALPLYTTVFLLGRLGEAMGVGDAIYGPRPLDGGATPDRSARRCEHQSVSWSNFVEDFGAPAPAGDWAGRYVNGDRQFVLEERDGTLAGPRGPDAEPYTIHPFAGDTYFAVVDGAARRFGFPIEIFRDGTGRRYVLVGERAYIHDADRAR